MTILRKYAAALIAALILSPICAPAAHAAICTSVNALAAPPVVTGTPQVGQILSTTNGGWTGNPTSFAYQWYGAGAVIAGATTSTYAPVVGDIGNTIQAGVIATNAGGASCTSLSAATTAVIAAPGIANISAPVITGTAQVGQTLTSSTGIWTITTGTTYAYQWNRGGVAIAAATASTYVPVTADVGNMLTVTVTATNGTSASSTSAATASVIPAVVNPPVNTVLPAVSGTAKVGSTLTTTNGTWTNTPTGYTYQWNGVGGTPATTFLVTLPGNDTGNVGFQQRELIPAALLSASGTVTGQVRVKFQFNTGTTAGTLNAYIGEQGSGNAWSYDGNQVQLKFGGVTPLTGIAGAQTVTSDYMPFTLNASKALVVGFYTGGTTVNLGINGSGVPTMVTYYSNTVVDPSVTNPAGLLTQTASDVAILEVDFKTTSSGPIAGATNSTYVPVAADIGNTLTASVTASNTGGQNTATSAATAAVTAATGAIPVNTAVPVISGFSSGTIPQVGLQLSTTNGTWTNTPTLPYTYQWNTSGGGAIKGFSVSGGQIIGPNGSAWTGRGIKISSTDLALLMPALPSTAPLTTLFHGINLVHIYNDPSVSFATMQGYINALTANGIVVILQDNTSLTGPVLSGTALTTSVNVIASYATAYLNNPYVWFTTQNEPQLYPSGGAYNLVPITAEQIAFYNGVRATGSNSMVVLSASGNPLDELFPSSVSSQYSGMTNVAWDLHYYNWMSTFATDVASNLAKVNTDATLHSAVTDVNGAIPVMINEYGDSTDATHIDPGWQATITAVNTAPNISGTAAFTWNANGGTGDQLGADQVHGNPASGLSAFGNLVESYISSGPTPAVPPLMSGPINGATAQTYVPKSSDVGNTLNVSVVASNATGASAPATSASTSAVIPATAVSTTARTADLLSTLGISGHVGNYTDNSQTVADAAYLGIGKWRDGISGLSAGTKTIYQGLVNGGIQIIGLPWLPTDNTFAGNVTGAESVKNMGVGALFAVEGPNEPSISTFTYNTFNSATTWQGVSQWQSGWYAAVRADANLKGVPVLTPSLVGAEPDNWGLQYLTTASGTLAATGLQYADGYNFHIYPMLDGIPSAQWIDPVQGDHFVNHENADFVSTYAHSFAGSTLSFVQSSLKIITETNLQTVPAPSAGGSTVDKPTQGKDVLNGFMNAWNEGFNAFCIYTFYPFSGDGTELFSGPGAPYAPATYIHNFTTVLHDAGATAKTFSTANLSYSISGLPPTAKVLLFQKSNGNFELVMWNNVTNWNKAAGTPIAIGQTTVSVNFPVTHGTINAYDPTSGTAPAGTVSNANVAGIQLKDYPVIVEIIN